jgi:hypothetical protein
MIGGVANAENVMETIENSYGKPRLIRHRLQHFAELAGTIAAMNEVVP